MPTSSVGAEKETTTAVRPCFSLLSLFLRFSPLGRFTKENFVVSVVAARRSGYRYKIFSPLQTNSNSLIIPHQRGQKPEHRNILY